MFIEERVSAILSSTMMKKRVVCFLMACVFSVGLVPAKVFAAEIVASGYYGYGNSPFGKNVMWSLDSDGLLTIAGSGMMYQWSNESAPWLKYKDEIIDVVIQEGVTNIASYAFSGCSNMKSMSIPDSILSIGRDAFHGCSSLTSISIPDTVTLIGQSAFMSCSSLTSISIPSQITTINQYTFMGCSSLTEVNLPDGLGIIGDGAFHSCSSLKTINLPNSVGSIGRFAFSYCSSLEHIDIPDSVDTIQRGSFGYCTSLTSIVLEKNLRRLDMEAFQHCSNLVSLTVLNSNISFGNAAFEYCNLKDIYYVGTKKQWEELGVSSCNSYYISAEHFHYCQSAPDPATGKVKVSNIKISAPEGTTVRVGESIQLLAMVYPSNATNKSVEWLYTDPSTNIISVDKTGKVTGLKAGKTMVGVVSADTNKLLDTIEITVEGVGAYAGYKYSFRNHITSFSSSGNYRIPPERYLQAGFSRAKADSLLVDWGGSCYGMSLSSILFYKDVLKEEHYDRNVHYPSQFDKPKTNDAEDKKLREMIELFQVSQFLPEASEYYFSAPEIAAEIARGNPVELHLIAEGASENAENNDTDDTEHAVVIYDCVFDSTYYYFDIYDCSGYVNSLICNVNGDWKIDYRDSKYDFYPYAYMTVGQMKTVYQSIKSGNVNNAVSLFSADSNYSYLFTPGTNLTLENTSGNKSTIEDGRLTGNIDDIRLMRKGSFTDNPTYTITVPTDDYTITGVNTLSMANDELSVAVEATGPITVSADLKTITAGAGDYSVTYTTYGNAYDTMTLTGTASDAVTCVLGENRATVTGAASLTASTTVSEETVNMTVTESGNTRTATFGTDIPDREKTPAPEYDLTSGTYEAGQTLTFTKDDDTVVYYSINGGDETIYSLPIPVDRSMTVTAHAEKYGYDNSDTVTLTYNLPEVEAPAPSVEEGTYQTAQYVDLSNGDYEADVYYTTNGEDPREDGLLFGSSLVLTEDTTVKAYAVKDGCASQVVTLQYDITLSDDFMLINAPSDQNGEVITADTLNDLTAVRLVVQKFSQGAKTGRFAVAFYDENGRYLGMGSRQAEIAEDTATVMVPITENIVGAAQMKVFLMDDSYCPAGSALKFVLNC